MKFVKLKNSSFGYNYDESNDLGMTILERFLTSDVGCVRSSFRDWALNDAYHAAEGNITNLDKEDDYIYLSDLYSEEKVPTRLKMTRAQFIQILDDWDTKVCKVRPQAVIIKNENGQFIIETMPAE